MFIIIKYLFYLSHYKFNVTFLFVFHYFSLSIENVLALSIGGIIFAFIVESMVQLLFFTFNLQCIHPLIKFILIFNILIFLV